MSKIEESILAFYNENREDFARLHDDERNRVNLACIIASNFCDYLTESDVTDFRQFGRLQLLTLTRHTTLELLARASDQAATDKLLTIARATSVLIAEEVERAAKRLSQDAPAEDTDNAPSEPQERTEGTQVIDITTESGRSVVTLENDELPTLTIRVVMSPGNDPYPQWEIKVRGYDHPYYI